MTSYLCAEPHRLVDFSDLQQDAGHPIDAARLQMVLDAMQSGVPLPPCGTFSWNGILFLIAGWHRLMASKKLGFTQLPIST